MLYNTEYITNCCQEKERLGHVFLEIDKENLSSSIKLMKLLSQSRLLIIFNKKGKCCLQCKELAENQEKQLKERENEISKIEIVINTGKELEAKIEKTLKSDNLTVSDKLTLINRIQSIVKNREEFLQVIRWTKNLAERISRE